MDKILQIIVVLVVILIMVIIMVGLIFNWGSGGQSFLGEFFNWLTAASRSP